MTIICSISPAGPVIGPLVSLSSPSPHCHREKVDRPLKSQLNHVDQTYADSCTEPTMVDKPQVADLHQTHWPTFLDYCFLAFGARHYRRPQEGLVRT